MIVTELVDDNTRIHHYSDAGYKIRQIETGIVYYDAVDVLPCRYTYEETDEPIPSPEPEPEVKLNPEVTSGTLLNGEPTDM